MKLITSIVILLALSCHLHGQITLVNLLNNSVMTDSIGVISKYFTSPDVYFSFKKAFQNKTEFAFLQTKTLKSSDRKIHYIDLKSQKLPAKAEPLVFFTETQNDKELINFIIFADGYSDSINEIIARNYLSHNFKQLSHFPENHTSQRLESIGKSLTVLFKENKDTFLLKYFRPEVCDNSIGDAWFLRKLDNKGEIINVEVTNVEFMKSFYDENLKCGIIKLSTTFSNNENETDILYFRAINNNFDHFHTSLNSDILKCLK
ncbi:MAG: hypothetical protein V4580_04060 [Bacteroidota bacterium]